MVVVGWLGVNHATRWSWVYDTTDQGHQKRKNKYSLQRFHDLLLSMLIGIDELSFVLLSFTRLALNAIQFGKRINPIYIKELLY